MNLKDITKNQHFISQTEQRLNALNPSAKKNNQKIFSFSVVDRESYKTTLDSSKGFKISNTLSLMDIFSFHVLENELKRYNFEKLFHQYESSIQLNTESLIAKLPNINSDIKPEVLNLFVSKFLNFIRNPYSIKKVLNTFPSLQNMRPTQPAHYQNFKKVLNGRKPQQQHLCKLLGVTEKNYADWLSIIFLLLTSFKENQTNFLEKIIKELYENPNNYISIFVYTYDEETCLLSDRGYSNFTPEGDFTGLGLDFNLNSNSFIRYFFGNLDSLAPKNIPKSIIKKYKSNPKKISFKHKINDLNELKKYNKHVIYQCHEKIFSASKDFHIS